MSGELKVGIIDQHNISHCIVKLYQYVGEMQTSSKYLQARHNANCCRSKMSSWLTADEAEVADLDYGAAYSVHAFMYCCRI